MPIQVSEDGSLVLNSAEVQRLMERGLLHRLDDGWYVGPWPETNAAISQDEVSLPLAGYPVPETISTREQALHCFACGGALSHSCSCPNVTLHRDGLASLIYWVQSDTVAAINAALVRSPETLGSDDSEMREALEPFAKAAELIGLAWREDLPLRIAGLPETTLTVGNLYKARTILGQEVGRSPGRPDTVTPSSQDTDQ